jgi:hypothetical protein
MVNMKQASSPCVNLKQYCSLMAYSKIMSVGFEVFTAVTIKNAAF